MNVRALGGTFRVEPAEARQAGTPNAENEAGRRANKANSLEPTCAILVIRIARASKRSEGNVNTEHSKDPSDKHQEDYEADMGAATVFKLVRAGSC